MSPESLTIQQAMSSSRPKEASSRRHGITHSGAEARSSLRRTPADPVAGMAVAHDPHAPPALARHDGDALDRGQQRHPAGRPLLASGCASNDRVTATSPLCPQREEITSRSTLRDHKERRRDVALTRSQEGPRTPPPAAAEAVDAIITR